MGNKSDLAEKRCVSYEEGKALAEKYKLNYIETSAKNSSNVIESFETLSRLIKSKVIMNPNENKHNMPVKNLYRSSGNAKTIAKKSECCK